MKKIILSIFVLIIVMGISVNVMAFSDLDSSHWAYNDIINMLDKGLIAGYEDSTFRPDNEITRAEYCVLVARVANMDIKLNSTNNHWAAPYIDAMKENTWSYKDWFLQEFNPDVVVNRGEASMGLRDVYFGYPRSLTHREGEVTSYLKNTYKDYDVFGGFAHTIYDVSNEKLMNGYNDGCFHPEKHITRAEMCAILNRAFLNNETTKENDVYDNTSNDTITYADVWYGTYTGTNIPTYTSVTGIPLKDVKVTDKGYVAYRYEFTQSGEYAEIVDYMGYLLLNGWTKAYENKSDGSLYYGFVKNSESVLVSFSDLDYLYEVWITPKNGIY